MSEQSTMAVIWDVDGTLVDTATLHLQAWRALADETSLQFTDEHFYSTFGWRNDEIIPHFFGDRFTREQATALSDRKEALYREEARNGVSLLPGVREIIQQIAETAIPQGVGSSAPRNNIELILEVTGIANWITAIVGSEDVVKGKPNPEVFLKAAEKLQVAPNKCIVIEDAPVGVQAAKAGGMRCIGVTFVGHHTKADLQNAGAEMVVESLAEVSFEDMRLLIG